jgi:hypothetical protein
MLRLQTTGIHFHAGSEPNFAVTTSEHPQGAWVIAKNPAKQQEFYQTAQDSLTGGFGGVSPIPLWIECERYEDSGSDRRFYWETTNVYPIGISLADPRVRSLPPLSQVIKNH